MQSVTPVSILTIEEQALASPDSPQGLEWEKLLRQSSHSGFMQSLHWAQFKKNSEQEVIHLILRDSSGIIGGALLYTSSDPRKPTILVSPYGPVLPWQNPELSAQCLRLILEKSEELARRVNAVSLRIEPRIPVPVPGVLHEFATAPVNLVPAQTLLLDLTLDENTLLQRMKAKCRYNIRIAEKKGVSVRELSKNDPEAVSTLYKLLEEAADRDNFYLEPEQFFLHLLESLLPSRFLRIFVAEHEDALLGVLAMVSSANQATYLYGGISNQKRYLMPGYALQWHAIREAKRAGCTSYDFYGYDEFQSARHAYAKFSRFKSGFAGNVKRYIGAHDFMFMDQLVDNVIGFFQDLRD